MASKMYILIKDSIDLGHAILASAHASLSGYLTFIEWERDRDNTNPTVRSSDRFLTNTDYWVKNSFRKVVCKVSEEEFQKAKTYFPEGSDYRVMVESGLDGIEVAIVFRPREDWPPFFKSLKLYK